MKCPRCNGYLALEPARWHGDTPAAKCLICGHRIWEPPRIHMPYIPAKTADELTSKERAAMVRASRTKRLQDKKAALLKELAEINKKEARL